MTTRDDGQCRCWSRYQWASVFPIPDEPDEPAWDLSQWPGDQGSGRVPRRVERCNLDTAGGFSGFGHNPGGGRRWAPVH